jgi:hypothetical protein
MGIYLRNGFNVRFKKKSSLAEEIFKTSDQLKSE